jgi:hypothetical protein
MDREKTEIFLSNFGLKIMNTPSWSNKNQLSATNERQLTLECYQPSPQQSRYSLTGKFLAVLTGLGG